MKLSGLALRFEFYEVHHFLLWTEPSKRLSASFRLPSRSGDSVQKLLMFEDGEVDFSRALTYSSACSINKLF
jgi:hypothetical protein